MRTGAVLWAMAGCGAGGDGGKPSVGRLVRASRNENPGVLPPHAHAYGKSYAEWGAAWWTWLSALPTDENPLFDTADCSAGQSGHVWFLGGKFCTTNCAQVQTVNRHCTVPAGTALFFPILNTTDGAEASLDIARSLVHQIITTATAMSAEIDGQPVQGLEPLNGPYYVGVSRSPVFSLTFPDNNIFGGAAAGVPAGTYPDFVTAGIYILHAPLSPGEHKIHFRGTLTIFPFSLDITYHITVTP